MNQIVTNGLPCATSFCESTKEAQMDTLLSFATLLAATILALFVALGLHWLLLRAAFLLMQPATASRRVAQPAIEHATRMVAHAYAQRR